MADQHVKLSDERILEIGRTHFKPDATDSPSNIAAFILCVRDILDAQAALIDARVVPLRRLGARLAELLDEDQFAECEQLLIEAGVTPPDCAAAEKEVPHD